MRSLQLSFAAAILLSAPFSSALDINLNSTHSISNVAKTIVENIISIYNGDNSTFIPGIFPKPYYWWEAGLAWDSLVNYWALTGDDIYNDQISQGLLLQIGSNENYMPANQTSTEGNDDQAMWALAAMTAAEKGFPAPPTNGGVKSWVQLAQNVFDTQALRWDTKTCGGGLRWQIESFSDGYNYKNSGSNGDFMQLAARLFHYTGNQTYSDWASKVSKWSSYIGLVDNNTFAVYDGTTVQQNCKNLNKAQWTANVGTYLSANVYMYNATKDNEWKTNIVGLYGHMLETFFSNKTGVLEEVACAPSDTCNSDQQAFRAILARALANAEALTPSLNYNTKDLESLISSSAKGAAGQCSGGKSETMCGSNWSSSKWDGSQGLGQDLSALEIILAALPSSGTRTQKSTATTGHTAGGSQTSSGSSPSNINGAANRGASMFVLATAVLFACLASA